MKRTKYLKYAIGEIILVVIGILIALQINLWNEARKNRVEADLIKENLLKEFEQNRSVLAERIHTIESSNAHAKYILELMGSDYEHTIDELDSILVYSLYYGNFNPPNSAILEILQTGKSSLIKDRELKNDLSAWLAMLEDTDEDFKNQDSMPMAISINTWPKTCLTETLTWQASIACPAENRTSLKGIMKRC